MERNVNRRPLLYLSSESVSGYEQSFEEKTNLDFDTASSHSKIRGSETDVHTLEHQLLTVPLD